MAKDNLLKEAIADAKAVKETAIANAMLTLKESFKPQLSSILAAKLRNENEDCDADDTVDEQKKLDSSDIGTGLTVDDPAPKQPAAAAKSSSDIDNPGQEVETFGEGIDEFGNPVQDAPAGDDIGGMGGEEEAGGEEDLDLEAIIRELEADLMGGEEGEIGGEPDAVADDEVEEAVPFGKGNTHIQPEGFNKVDAGVDVNAGVTTEEKAKTDDLSFPEADEEKVTEGEVEEEVDLEEILREVGAEDSVSESEKIASENVELKRSLREHREVIKLLRSRINEVTLLNSKLMYTTKIFRSFDLTEGMKKKVVTQFDRATTLREAKIVYSTLAESLQGKVGNAAPRRVVSKITEGASKSIGSTKPKSTPVLTEGNEQVARMQKLAGITLG